MCEIVSGAVRESSRSIPAQPGHYSDVRLHPEHHGGTDSWAHAAARLSSNSRSRALRVSAAARSNSVRADERILREILSQSDVVHDARQTGDDPGGLNSPDGVDRAMCGGI